MATHYTGVSWTTVTVYTSPSSGVLSPIYTDAGLTTPKDNPFVSFGNYSFYAAAGQYVILGDFTRLIGGSAPGAGSSWIPLVDGSEPPVFITDGLGHLILVAFTP